MSEWLVISDKTELPRNASLQIINRYPYSPGALIVFRIGQRISVGRWLPNVGGFNWILQPDRLICLIGCTICILGEVIATYIASSCWN